MKINIHIENATLAEARQLLGGQMAEASIEVQAAPVIQIEPKDDPTPVAEAAPEAAPEAKAAPVANGEDTSRDASVLDTMKAKMKPTANVALSDGVKVSEGDEVSAKDTGEVGVVLATFRGNLCVALEDGTQAACKAADLVSVPQDDETATEAADEPSEADLLGEPAADVTEADLRSAARELLGKEGAVAVSNIFKTVGDAKNVSEVVPEKRGAVLAALQAAL